MATDPMLFAKTLVEGAIIRQSLLPLSEMALIQARLVAGQRGWTGYEYTYAQIGNSDFWEIVTRPA